MWMRRRGGCWSWCGRSLVCFVPLCRFLVSAGLLTLTHRSAHHRHRPADYPHCARGAQVPQWPRYPPRDPGHTQRVGAVQLAGHGARCRADCRCAGAHGVPGGSLTDGRDGRRRRVALSTLCSSIVHYNDQCLFLYMRHPTWESARARLRPTGRHLLRLRVSASS
jgi:hypothetical protein